MIRSMEQVIEEAKNRKPKIIAVAVAQDLEVLCAVKKAKEEEGLKFRDYFDWSETAFKAPSHRILAMLRGQNESMLSVHVLPDEERALHLIEKRIVKNQSRSALEVKSAIKDSYKRLYQ